MDPATAISRSLRSNKTRFTLPWRTQILSDSILSKWHVVSFWWFRVELSCQKTRTFSELLSTAEETCHECHLCDVLFSASRVEQNLHTSTASGTTVARWHWGCFEGTDCSWECLLFQLRHLVAFWDSLGCGPWWIQALPSEMPLYPIGHFRFTQRQLAHCSSNQVCFLSCVQNTATWSCDVAVGTATSYGLYGLQLESRQWPEFVTSSKLLWPRLLLKVKVAWWFVNTSRAWQFVMVSI